MPLGSTGEIVIAGIAVGRGYLNRPDLTAEKFVPNPLATPGEMSPADARLYRTGDRACGLPDGNLEFLGRRDHQIKIRGHRVELEEIESVLREHAAVQDAVVVAQEIKTAPSASVDGFESRQPVATSCDNPRAVSENELRPFLQPRLPEFMMPAGFIFLDSLPPFVRAGVDRARCRFTNETRAGGNGLRRSAHRD
jgi:acyl-CoA synthetase (AMP-forming)/AMP-acid ligase II